MASELKINRSYLDTKFEGYKLDTSDLCRHSIEISEDIDIVRPNDDQFSFLQQREFSLHNHLHSDPWNQNSVYIVDSKKIIYKITVNTQIDCGLDEPFQVWEFPLSAGRVCGQLNITICFASEDLALVSDGAGSVYIVSTGDRNLSPGLWKELYCIRLEKFVRLLDARSPNSGQIHSLSSHVDAKHTYITYLYFLSDAGGNWKLERTTTLYGKGSVDFAALDSLCHSAYVIGQVEVKSEELIEAEKNKPPEEPKEISFEWQQSFEDIKIWIKSIEGRKLSVSITPLQLNILAPDGQAILEGRFHRPVEDGLSVWRLVQREGENYLEVVVTKRDDGSMWTELFESSDFYGKEIPDPELAAEIHTKLAHLTSETEDVGGATVLNSSQLEECDITDGVGRLLVQYDLSSPLLQPINRVELGNGQWLIAGARTKKLPPQFCLRFDVDGIVWEINEKSVDHVATLCAYGFVQASKSSRIFSFIPEDASYGGLVDSDGRVLIYRNGVRPLNKDQWGSQHIVSLGKTKILGVHATKSHVFVLSEKHLHLIKVSPLS